MKGVRASLIFIICNNEQQFMLLDEEIYETPLDIATTWKTARGLA